MKLFNTMSRSIEELKPIQTNHISLYTCGPTVYDYAQIGNWATYIRWDLLVRVLKTSNYQVNWVMNITDVGHLTSDADEGQDKLEKGARREGKTAWEVAGFYTQDFLEGMKALNITMPSKLAKATDHIDAQIELIKKLEAKAYTYVIEDGVYFDTSRLADYGKLARLKLADLKEGARVTINKQKRNPSDFALWKFSPKNEKRDMEWASPWGIGFPGWHLECSAMAMEYLGETIDIHAGGIDFIPIHHTNEIAQSEAATGKPFANIWLHGNFITADGLKLSKSLGNSYTLHDVIAKGYSPLDLRMLFLQSHYRTQADFTWESLDAARERRKTLQAMADLRWQENDTEDKSDSIDFKKYQVSILGNLQDDLNTPQAMAEISSVEQLILAGNLNLPRQPFQQFLQFVDELFGLGLLKSADINEAQKHLIKTREDARLAKNFSKADQIRIELQKQNIGLRDTDKSTLWHRL